MRRLIVTQHTRGHTHSLAALSLHLSLFHLSQLFELRTNKEEEVDAGRNRGEVQMCNLFRMLLCFKWLRKMSKIFLN